jgi:hypothetical protein
MLDLFPTPGVYKLVVVVDGTSEIDEQPNGPSQAKSNNVFGPIDIMITGTPSSTRANVFLPVIVKP